MTIQKKLDRHFDVLWVSELIAASIKHSGFTPCLGIEHLISPQAIPTLLYSNQAQSIITHRMGEHFVKIIKFLSPGKILVSNAVNLNEKRPLLIADCFHAEVHDILQRDGNIVTLRQPLNYRYASTAYAGEWIEERWFIKKNVSGKFTLYYHSIHTEELTSLIQALHITKHQVRNKSVFEISLQDEDEKITNLYIAALNS